MTVGRIKSFPYPERIDSLPSIEDYLKKLYRSLTEDQVEKLTDFEDMDVDSLQISDLTISTSIKPTADATVDLGAVGATDYRFRHLYLSGNLSDETNTLTVANAKSAYTHSQIAGGNSVHVSTTENTNWDSAYSHISATGASHSYINQDVTSTSTTATLAKLQVSGATNSGLNLTHANSYLYFSGSTGSKGIAYKDTGSALRAAMRFPSGSNVVTLINHAANGTVEIHANTATTDLAGDVTVATFEDDNVTIATTMSVAGTLTIPTALTGVIRADSGVLSVEGTAVLDADFGSAGLCATNGSGTYSIVTDNSSTWDALISCTFANVDTALAAANSAVDFNSQNLTGVGTIASGDITVDAKLVFSAGSITDGDGAISFGDENLSTSGTLGCGLITTTSGITNTTGALTLNDDAGQDITMFASATTGENPYFYIKGYKTGVGVKYGRMRITTGGDLRIAAQEDLQFTPGAGFHLRLMGNSFVSNDRTISYGTGRDYSIGYHLNDDEFQIVDGETLDSNVRLKLNSSGHFDFGAGNLSTTGTISCTGLNIVCNNNEVICHNNNVVFN